ncbi:MAG TPA: tryptophan synthase subunit alpha, partial [Gemmatimonadales bacterium]|nr:tryptophan synthase subunit alpha [Gemmatimonadales bacterium]
MTTSFESLLARRLGDRRAAGRPALIPFVTAGHPSPAATRDLLAALAPVADAVEVGIPFSDPLADGPVIQRASHEALAGGMTPAGVLDLVAATRPPVPVVLFSYLNPVLQYGVTAFLRDAADAGASGLLLTDLPVGADPAIEDEVRASPLDLVPLAAPTTTPARLRRIGATAQGFVYLVARLGVTGARADLDAG